VKYVGALVGVPSKRTRGFCGDASLTSFHRGSVSILLRSAASESSLMSSIVLTREVNRFWRRESDQMTGLRYCQ
jgi:hypothetical protein